jgi:hypothetical protein
LEALALFSQYSHGIIENHMKLGARISWIEVAEESGRWLSDDPQAAMGGEAVLAGVLPLHV